MANEVKHLGPCCRCGGSKNVCNLIGLDGKAPVPGTGWGCVQCGLPPDGALVIVCDECAVALARASFSDPHAECVWVIYGDPVHCARAAIDCVQGTHQHDMTRHVSPI